MLPTIELNLEFDGNEDVRPSASSAEDCIDEFRLIWVLCDIWRRLRRNRVIIIADSLNPLQQVGRPSKSHLRSCKGARIYEKLQSALSIPIDSIITNTKRTLVVHPMILSALRDSRALETVL